MRTWITSDSHFGKYNTQEWADIQFDYYYNFFIPKIKYHKKEDDILIHCGDVFDNRNLLDISVLNRTVKLFEDLSLIFPKIYIVCGNHDTYQKNSNLINSINILGYISNVELVIDKPKILEFDNKRIALMQWGIDTQDELRSLDYIQSSDFLFAHTSVVGAIYSGSRAVEHGNTDEVFYKYGKVYSGHIHTSQVIKNIRFVGSPYELTRNDINNPKSIWCVDFKTGQEFSILNDYSPKFLRFNYREIENRSVDEINKLFKNNFVDVVVDSEMKDTKQFDLLNKKLSNVESRNFKFKFQKDIKTEVEELILENSNEEVNQDDLIKLFLENKGYKDSLITKVQKFINKEIKQIEEL